MEGARSAQLILDVMLTTPGPAPRVDHPTGQLGYTAIEMMVVVAIMSVVLGALLGVLDNLTKSQVRTESLVTNQESVRLGLDRIERELRAANPLDGFSATATYSNQVQVELVPNPGTRQYIR